MNKVYRDGQQVQEPVQEELEALELAAQKGVYIEIESEELTLIEAVAGITDVLALAAYNEPNKIVKIRLEIYEGENL